MGRKETNMLWIDVKADRSNPIPGGIGDHLKPKDVDSKELQMGIEVEMEHVGGDSSLSEDEKRNRAQDIALDHLAEHKDYYTRLKRMEQEIRGGDK
jgi:hypothetical protein